MRGQWDRWGNGVPLVVLESPYRSLIEYVEQVTPTFTAFAQMMIDDHGAAENKLKSAISGHQIEWPAQLDENTERPPTSWRRNKAAISIAAM